MNETNIMIADAKDELSNMAKQTHDLGVGLQNLALGDNVSSTNTIKYLLSISANLMEIAATCETLLPKVTHDVQRKEP